MTVVLTKTIYDEGKFAMAANERGGLHELCFERKYHDLLTMDETGGEGDYEELIVRKSCL